MAVFTRVSEADITAWLNNYSLGTLLELQGIPAGIENTNYFVTTSNGRWFMPFCPACERNNMFDLEQSIADWRRQMLAAGIKTPAPLEELEIHLREEIERQIKAGAIEPQAFEAATERMGQAGPIKIEFKKINAETWNRPMAWTAWTLFAVSFFLPAYADGPGWHSRTRHPPAALPPVLAHGPG